MEHLAVGPRKGNHCVCLSCVSEKNEEEEKMEPLTGLDLFIFTLSTRPSEKMKNVPADDFKFCSLGSAEISHRRRGPASILTQVPS